MLAVGIFGFCHADEKGSIIPVSHPSFLGNCGKVSKAERSTAAMLVRL
jgi:hypothetical protein